MLTVSAIVPTCNRPLLLQRALQSIAAQTSTPFETIVIDDTAPDHWEITRKQLATWGFGHAQVVANSHVKGPSGARNTGAEIAHGELLAFLDDDDEWLPSYLNEMLRRFGRDDLDIVCADLLCRFEDEVDRHGKSAPDRLRPQIFLTRNPGFIGSNIVVRRSLYKDIGGFDESLLTAEDMDFGLRLSVRNDVKYARLPKRLVRFHDHKGPRLCTPAGTAMSAGIRRFYELHSHRMTAARREEFGAHVRRFWGIDEHGNRIDSQRSAYADSLLISVKAWLGQHRHALKK
jgi:glycosyltransferase involved in cell wall biosynthesis